MSLLKKSATRKAKTTKASKTPKRVLATLGAAFVLGGSIFGFAACGPKDKVEVVPDEQTNSQQANFNELQQQLEQLQNEMNGLKQDVSKLKENDAAILQLISSNMTIVQNLISDLQKQITSISSQVSANQQDIENLKQSQKEIASQLSTLQANMEAFASQLETLKGQTSDKTDSKTIKDLQKSVTGLQSIINRLVAQNAINATFTIDYNDVYVTHDATGENTSGHYYTAPNGNYAMDVSLEGLGELEEQKAVYTNGLYFFKDHNGNEEVQTSDTTALHTAFYKAIETASSVVADDNAYTFQQTKDKTTTFYLSNDGKISKVVDCYNGDDKYYYSFSQISERHYNREQSYIASQISTYGYYQDICTAFGKSFDYKYGVFSATMSDSDGSTGEGKIVVGNGELAQYLTTVELDGTSTAAGTIEDGVTKTIQQAASGEITEYIGNPKYYQHIDMKYYEENMRDAVFSDTFKIEYNPKTDTYVVTATDDEYGTKQVFTVSVDEDGKFTSFEVEITSENGQCQTMTYQLEGVTKAKFEKAFAEIKAQYEELLAKKNENNTNL